LEVHPCTTPQDGTAHRAYRWAWQLLANTGMRRGEALHLRWADVGQEEIRILSDAQQRTNSGHWRAVTISDGAGHALDELRDGTAWVLPRMRPESLSRAFDRTATRSEVGGHLHCLRHTYCSHLVQAGVPLRTVQVLAGHASYKTTERYAHLAPGNLQDAVRSMAI
jgi:integrase